MEFKLIVILTALRVRPTEFGLGVSVSLLSLAISPVLPLYHFLVAFPLCCRRLVLRPFRFPSPVSSLAPLMLFLYRISLFSFFPSAGVCMWSSNVSLPSLLNCTYSGVLYLFEIGDHEIIHLQSVAVSIRCHGGYLSVAVAIRSKHTWISQIPLKPTRVYTIYYIPKTLLYQWQNRSVQAKNRTVLLNGRVAVALASESAETQGELIKRRSQMR